MDPAGRVGGKCISGAARRPCEPRVPVQAGREGGGPAPLVGCGGGVRSCHPRLERGAGRPEPVGLNQRPRDPVSAALRVSPASARSQHRGPSPRPSPTAPGLAGPRRSLISFRSFQVRRLPPRVERVQGRVGAGSWVAWGRGKERPLGPPAGGKRRRPVPAVREPSMRERGLGG